MGKDLDDLKDISQLALELLKIAEEITQKRPLNLDELVKEAKKKLVDYSSEEISYAIYDLILKKVVMPEKRIVKTQVLANSKRDAIYRYIMKKPGAHLREIREQLNLTPHVTNLHLKVLEDFEYVRSKKHLKYRVYFPSDFNPESELAILSLKNKSAEDIFWFIQTENEVSLNQIQERFVEELSSKMVGYHLEPLVSSGLVITFERDGQEIFKINNESFEKIEKWLISEEEFETLAVKRAFDYIGGNIRFKVVVENKSKENIKNISVELNLKEQFEVENNLQIVKILEPEESRGVDFMLTPLACGKSKVQGQVFYHNIRGEGITTEIKPVLVQIKCPLVTPRVYKLLDVLKMKDRFQVSHAGISYRGLSQAQAFRIAMEQVASLDMSEVGEAEGFSAIFSGEAKVTGHPILVDLSVDEANINLDIYMGDVKQATGFLAYIKNLINIALSYSVQISTSVEKIRNMILNGFEFSARLSELFAFCESREAVEDILILLRELQIKAQSYFPDIKLLESLNKWYSQFESLQGKEIFAKTYLNLQYDIQDWMDDVITFTETNAKIYYESTSLDEATRNEITQGISKLTEKLNQHALQYSQNILFSLMLIHKNTGLTVFNHNFTEEAPDPDLLSGFLTAIGGFGREIKEETTMRKLTYEHFEIELIDGGLITGALITTGQSNPITIRSLNEFVRRFEIQYRQQLLEFSGNVSQFNPAAELIQQIFLI